jgi:heme/copper-type cytochrome/quinol oxidase subunit 2
MVAVARTRPEGWGRVRRASFPVSPLSCIVIRHTLADAIFWLAVVSCAIAQVALIRSSLTAAMQPTTDPLPQTRRAVEVVWTVIPAFALAALLWFTWHAIHDRHLPHSVTSRIAAVSLSIGGR